jgi:hypothetical protein
MDIWSTFLGKERPLWPAGGPTGELSRVLSWFALRKLNIFSLLLGRGEISNRFDFIISIIRKVWDEDL